MFGTLLYSGIAFFGLPLRQGVHTGHKSGLFLMKLRGGGYFEGAKPISDISIWNGVHPPPPPCFACLVLLD